MAVRADFDLKNALIKTYTVDAAAAVVAGQPVKFGSTDLVVVACAASDVLMIGMAQVTAAAGFQTNVVLSGSAIVPAIVGTGGSTRGTKQKFLTGAVPGMTDITASTDVTTGRAMQSGVVGDLIGLLVGGY